MQSLLERMEAGIMPAHNEQTQNESAHLAQTRSATAPNKPIDKPTKEAGADCPREQTHNELLGAIELRVEKMAAYFGRRCGVDEDDLRQEAWVAVLEMLPRLDHSVGVPEQHLLKRARWRILDSIRRQRRRQHVALEDVPPTLASYLDTRHSGPDMGALFARLTTIQQRILRALMEGYTWREAGAIVGCTSANVAYHVRRIREVYVHLDGDDSA